MRIKIEKKAGTFAIRINELLHVFFKTNDFVGFQSWYEGHQKYFIEYYFLNGVTIKTEYNSQEKFDFILDALEKTDWNI